MEEYCTSSYFIGNPNLRDASNRVFDQYGLLQGPSCHDRMVVGFTTTCVNVYYH